MFCGFWNFFFLQKVVIIIADLCFSWIYSIHTTSNFAFSFTNSDVLNKHDEYMGQRSANKKSNWALLNLYNQTWSTINYWGVNTNTCLQSSHPFFPNIQLPEQRTHLRWWFLHGRDNWCRHYETQCWFVLNIRYNHQGIQYKNERISFHAAIHRCSKEYDFVGAWSSPLQTIKSRV